MQRKKIAIVGDGRYGKFLKKFLEKLGHEVRVSDIGTSPSTEEIVRWADVVLIAVTLMETVKVIRSLIPYLRADQLIMDVSSTKILPVKAMLESKAEVVGLHPFTAPPKQATFRGQTIFVTYARLSVWREWVDEFLLETEAFVEEIDVDTHDRERTIDQVLEHMCGMLKMMVMRRMNVDASRLFKVASPVYKLETVKLARLLAQSASLYGALPMTNPHALDTLRIFAEEFRRYTEIVANSDMESYTEEFAANKGHIGEQTIKSSYELSEHVIGLTTDLVEKNSLRARMTKDVPGMLERIGAIFREAGVNLRAFHSRRFEKGWEFFVAFDEEKASPAIQSVVNRLGEELGAVFV